jgi:hypothetical protein
MVEKQAMSSILCHIGNPRSSKPDSLQAYGKLREKMLLSPWVSLSEGEFVKAITEKGQPYYGCIVNGGDLFELGQEKLCWRLQTLVATDYDACDVPVMDMAQRYEQKGFKPFLGHNSFSHRPESGLHNYRLIWRVKCDINLSYEEVGNAIKKLASFSNGKADVKCRNASRLWQGTTSGAVFYNPDAPHLDLRQLVK